MKNANPYADIIPFTLSDCDECMKNCHACFILTNEKDWQGINRPKIYIQAIDSYSRQHEFILQYTHRYDPATDKSRLFWELHSYRHVGNRKIIEMKDKDALKLFNRITETIQKYPSLWFNPMNETTGRNVGFFRFNEAILEGYDIKTNDLLP